MSIASSHNPVVKFVRSLERSSVRREHAVYLIEGIRLVSEAVACGVQAQTVLYVPDLLKRSEAGTLLLNALSDWSLHSYAVSDRILASAAQTESPSGILAVVPMPDEQVPDMRHRKGIGLVLDQVADPGNAGAILRTADAVGVSYVATLKGTVDLFAPKVVRAGMGAHFRLSLCQHLTWDVLPRVPIIVLDARADCSIYDLQWPDDCALLVGSEAHGVSIEDQSRVTSRVFVPMRRGVESLNAAVAVSVALYAALGENISATS